MTAQNLTKLTKKYSQREIAIAARVLVDILAMGNQGEFGTVDPKKEFTPSQIKRLQKQLADHKAGKAQYLSLTQIRNALGL